MNIAIIAAIAYGIIALIGGIIGYTQARSTASLISGIISGLLLVAGGVLYLQGQAWGFTLALAVTAILVIVFTIRLVKTRKFMPAGLMLTLGVLTLVMMVLQIGAIA
ncbi:TMEM14 family protein [Gloeocapsopsis dulcis]|uniref:Small integral membrane protein n=1 Tax=Gloeocapsopsis dulcis AAB1 = 1H9 TaxID=1433147 RepID=A0A6N8G253_9CHRO|nr:TMEM14 family protein [Gloeocapsopsis dulcis]MUL38427.1 hypothetical protein [Gloeocapsopsis dulcis AAB1 = 1H9]WNN89751.1 TMEM14 family protein [Gloeocapsopsis dulcis]